MQKKRNSGGGVVLRGGRGQGGCERRIEIQGEGGGGGLQGGCERRIEVFVKIKKN